LAMVIVLYPVLRGSVLRPRQLGVPAEALTPGVPRV